MILVAGLALIILSVPLTGGRLRHVLDLRLRSGWLVGTALLCQTLIISVLPTTVPRMLAETIHIGTYGMAVAFLWRNRRIPWLWLVSLGGGLNLTAIVANHGVMPASQWALTAAGMADQAGFANSAVVHHAVLPFLGDVFPIPSGLPLANVFSVGDVVLLVGAALLLHSVTRHGPRPRPRLAAGISARLSPGALLTIDHHRRRAVVQLETGASLHRVAPGSKQRLELHLPGGTVTCADGTVASMTDDDRVSTIVVMAGSISLRTVNEEAVLGPQDAVLLDSNGSIRSQIRVTPTEFASDPWLAANALSVS